MASIIVWFLLITIGGISGIGICSLFEGNEVLTGYAAMLGMIIALLSAIFFQLHIMHRDQKH
ncbi:hypothetical protein [Bacillus kexueae]|uniref:hypothetical protein n=1 Tax=Aeribacillus kexueae TaxID=2078952 RepID=UPI001FB04463|nr:hypothetical protein [Bacillus kexueae]